MTSMGICYACGNAFPEKFTIYRNTLCPSCGADAKVCLNCSFYDRNAHWECGETIPEAVWDKDRANFCDHFRLSSASRRGERPEEKKQEKAKEAFGKLFGD